MNVLDKGGFCRIVEGGGNKMRNAILIALSAVLACDVDEEGSKYNSTPLEETVVEDGQDGDDEFSPDVDEEQADVQNGPSAPSRSPAASELDRQGLPEQTRGFGCPLYQHECHNHCKSIPGYKGGYCKGLFKQTCKCY